MDSKQFEGWPTERVLGGLKEKIEQDVPFEHKEALQPYITEIENRVGLFTGDLTPAQVAQGQEAGASTR